MLTRFSPRSSCGCRKEETKRDQFRLFCSQRVNFKSEEEGSTNRLKLFQRG